MKTIFAIVYTPSDFEKAIEACPRGQIVILDDVVSVMITR